MGTATRLEHLSSPRFCTSLFLLLSFCMAIVLSILRFAASDYPFVVFTLVLVVFEYILLKVLQEEFEDAKGIIRIRKSKKDRQHH
jgi:hypothetical protein